MRTSFSSKPEIRARGPLYAAKAKKALQDDFEHVCIENVQASILIGNICYGDAHADVESLYFGKSAAYMNGEGWPAHDERV